jgi:hypothetical protein
MLYSKPTVVAFYKFLADRSTIFMASANDHCDLWKMCILLSSDTPKNNHELLTSGAPKS